MDLVLNGLGPCQFCGRDVPGGSHWCEKDPARRQEIEKSQERWIKAQARKLAVKDALKVAESCSTFKCDPELLEWALETLAAEVRELDPPSKADELLDSISR